MNPENHTVLPPELTQTEEHTLVVPPREDSSIVVIPAGESNKNVFDSSEKNRDMLLAGLVSILVTVAVAGGAFITGAYTTIPKDDTAHVALEQTPQVIVPDVSNPYFGISLEARSAVVYDVLDERFLFTQNESSVRSLASLTKVMTGILAVEHADTMERIAIPLYAIETEGDSGLYANETWNLKELVNFTLVTSSNDGADAVAAVVGMDQDSSPDTNPAHGVDVFVNRMNQKAKELGLTTLFFNNPTGLDDSNGTYGGRGTAADMAKLVAYAWNQVPELFNGSTQLASTYTSLDGFVHEALNTNKYVGRYPSLLGSKTGYTDYAGGNLAIMYDAGMNHPIVIVVLGSSIDGRFSDVEKLIDATGTYMTSGWYSYEIEQGSGTY